MKFIIRLYKMWRKMLTRSKSHFNIQNVNVGSHASKNEKHLERKKSRQMCCSRETTMHFYLIMLSKDLLYGRCSPPCLGIMYYERRDPCITMERGSIPCRFPSASWSKPHTSDSVYPASSTAVPSLISLKKNIAACHRLHILDSNANQETQASIVSDGVFASAH